MGKQKIGQRPGDDKRPLGSLLGEALAEKKLKLKVKLDKPIPIDSLLTAFNKFRNTTGQAARGFSIAEMATTQSEMARAREVLKADFEALGIGHLFDYTDPSA